MEPPLLPLLHLGLDQVVQALAPALLHALEAHAQVHRQREPERLVRLKHVEPAEHGALVVGGTATDEAPCGIVDGQGEGISVPAIAFFGLEILE